MEKPIDSFEFKNRDQWRSWLEENYNTESETWLVLYKKKYQHLGLTLDEVVEEALCFGWIDGKLMSMDEKRFALRFSPRTRASIWSLSNIRRVEKLIAEGKMTPAGQAKIDEAQERGEWDAAIRREQVDEIPQALENELRKREGAIAAYQALPDSRKKIYLYWLQSAKREETRMKRIQKIIETVVSESPNPPARRDR